MDTKTLERLLIDQRLGDLPQDVGELLDTYLVLNPEHTGIAEDLDTTIAMARKALQTEPSLTSDAMPPLSTRSFRVPARPQPRWRRWPRHLAVAAGLLLAFFLGSRSVPEQVSSSPSHAQITKSSPIKPNTSGFWSFDRLHEAHSDRRPQTTQRIEWTTPLRQPRIGERT